MRRVDRYTAAARRSVHLPGLHTRGVMVSSRLEPGPGRAGKSDSNLAADYLSYCHRDIKDENILVDMSALKIKLIDFGSATDVKPDSYTMSRGTPEYWAPEFYLEGRQRAEELTIWSLGAVFYIMVTGEWNFAPPAYTPNPDKEKKLSMTSRQLLRAMLCANPNQRCRFDQLQLRNC